MPADRVLLIGMSLIFVAITIAAFTVISGSIGRRGVARAMASIDRDYAPGSAGSTDDSLRQRMSPAVQQVTTLGKSLTPKGCHGVAGPLAGLRGQPSRVGRRRG